jgi:hypothetical protein
VPKGVLVFGEGDLAKGCPRAHRTRRALIRRTCRTRGPTSVVDTPYFRGLCWKWWFMWWDARRLNHLRRAERGLEVVRRVVRAVVDGVAEHEARIEREHPHAAEQRVEDRHETARTGCRSPPGASRGGSDRRASRGGRRARRSACGRPQLVFGTQWKKVRWSQYSVSVQVEPARGRDEQTRHQRHAEVQHSVGEQARARRAPTTSERSTTARA